jgi:Arc/MetJ-type ribon-helix-helix transcriptional regulator
VKSGRYNSASEVVREALRLLEDHEKAALLNSKSSARNSTAAWLPVTGARGLKARKPSPESAGNPKSAARSVHEALRCRARSRPGPGRHLGYIAEDSLAAADRFLEKLYKNIRMLAETPGMGHAAKISSNSAGSYSGRWVTT